MTSEAARRLPEPDVFNDATVYGAVPEDILSRTVSMAQSKMGAKTAPGRWRTVTSSVREVLNDTLTLHRKAQEKDGPCSLAGSLVGFDRKSTAVDTLYWLVLDLDCGEDPVVVRDRIWELGWFAVLHTSWSDGKNTTDVKKDAVLRWLGKGVTSATCEDVLTFLRSVKRYREPVLVGATLAGEPHTAEGFMFRIKHQPMAKLRAWFLLEKPFIFAERGATHAAGQVIWKNGYRGMAKLLDVATDRACLDPARLWYLPRHPAGNDDWCSAVIAGKPLDFDALEQVTEQDERRAGMGAFEQAAEDMKASNGAQYKTTGLARFAAKFADRFDADTCMLEMQPDGDRGHASRGRTHRCPGDADHSDAGNEEDKGFFVVNACDAESGGFVMSCRHDSCSGRDRLDLLDLFCEEVGITDAAELRRWVPETVEDHDEDAKESAPNLTGYDDSDEAKAAAKDVPDSDVEAAAEVAYRVGLSGFTGGPVEAIKALLCGKRVRLSAKTFNAEVARGQADARRSAKPRSNKLGNGKVREEDDDETGNAKAEEQLEKLLMTHAHVTIGADYRILRESANPTDRPSLIKPQTFVAENAPYYFRVEGKETIKHIPVTTRWMQHQDRRIYRDGLQFEPPPKTISPDAYNLFGGFAIKASPNGSWSILEEHILSNVCQGVETYRDVVYTWIADIWQFPGRKLGCCLSLVGKKGTGKGELGRHLIHLFGRYAFELSQRRHLLGNFNQHQRARLLMVCDEATFPGRAEENSILKNKITSEAMLTEGKGLEIVEMSDYARILMLANPGWFVPAGLEDERRFFVLGLGDERLGDFDFFARMAEQLSKGGYERMAYDLAHWVPPMAEGWNILRRPPVTPWLKEQAEKTLSDVQRFLHDVGDRGSHTYTAGFGADSAEVTVILADSGPTLIGAEDLMDHYLAWLRDRGVQNRTRHMDRAEMKAAVLEMWGATFARTKSGSRYTVPMHLDVVGRLAKVLGDGSDPLPLAAR